MNYVPCSKMMMNKLLRGMKLPRAVYSSTAFELGPVFSTESLVNENVKYFHLNEIDGIAAALQAPEGSVVIKSQSRASYYDMRKYFTFCFMYLIFL